MYVQIIALIGLFYMFFVAGTVLFTANKTETESVYFERTGDELSEVDKADFKTFFTIAIASDNRSFSFIIAKELNLEYFFEMVSCSF